jgi:hypothetical protein
MTRAEARRAIVREMTRVIQRYVDYGRPDGEEQHFGLCDLRSHANWSLPSDAVSPVIRFLAGDDVREALKKYRPETWVASYRLWWWPLDLAGDRARLAVCLALTKQFAPRRRKSHATR